jgi:hypothetical protein
MAWEGVPRQSLREHAASDAQQAARFDYASREIRHQSVTRWWGRRDARPRRMNSQCVLQHGLEWV